jgi:ABC-type multidrug transport system fused ATPase/permease subunit
VKSRTLQLLQKFYDRESGKILIDGLDLDELSGTFMRSQIAIVPQQPVLFSMSVKDNIRFGRRNATYEDVNATANVGNAHDFIMQLPENHDT